MTKFCKCGHALQDHFTNGCMYFGTPNKKVVCECEKYEFLIEDEICRCGWDHDQM